MFVFTNLFPHVLGLSPQQPCGSMRRCNRRPKLDSTCWYNRRSKPGSMHGPGCGSSVGAEPQAETVLDYRTRVMPLRLWILTLLVGTCAHQAQDLFCRKMKLSHLVVDETLGTWGQSFIFALINLAAIPHPPMCGSPKCFPCSSVEEPYFHQQHGHSSVIWETNWNQETR